MTNQYPTWERDDFADVVSWKRTGPLYIDRLNKIVWLTLRDGSGQFWDLTDEQCQKLEREVTQAP